MQVLLSRAAESYLKRLPEPQKSRILAALESLGHEPPEGDIIRLTGPSLVPRSLTSSTAMNAASPANYYNSSESVTQINVNSNINTAVPAGTPVEQKAAIQRQTREAVHNEWAQVIQGARGLIPSPEGRGAL